MKRLIDDKNNNIPNSRIKFLSLINQNYENIFLSNEIKNEVEEIFYMTQKHYHSLSKFANIYRNVAPVDKPKITRNDPSHLPNMKPPTKKIGEPKPNKRTQIIVPKKNNILDKIIFLFLIPSKVSLLFLINS